MPKQRKIKRGTCGFCMVDSAHRHRNCPGTLGTASAGKPWTCWCYENGHPEVLPPAPVMRIETEGDLGEENEGRERVREARTTSGLGDDEGPETPKPTEAHRATGERCGHPTSRGPCKRRAGHTKGHDGR